MQKAKVYESFHPQHRRRPRLFLVKSDVKWEPPKASFRRRAAALFIDIVIYQMVTIGTYSVLGLSLNHQSPVSLFLALIYTFLLSCLPLYIWGQTLGKRLLKIKVVPTDFGRKPLAFWQVVVRETFGKGFSIVFLGAGFFWALRDKNLQSWHDKLAKTYVVKFG
jgi:uncharacterized RDD family membrane protein YckC